MSKITPEEREQIALDRRRLLADLESWRPRREGESLIEWARRISESEEAK